VRLSHISRPDTITTLRNHVNALLNNDVQVTAVGRTNLPPSEVVVSPGESIPMVGPLMDTDPEGDDICSVPLINGRCPGPIWAGPNGIAETHANNRNAYTSLTGTDLTSAYRNPQRNRAVNSSDVNSRHTRGKALDIDPRVLSIPGKSSRELMCIIEYAGDLVVGDGFSFTESGPSDVVDCNSNVANHVHIQN